MSRLELTRVIGQAKKACAHASTKLTKKRQRILELLVLSKMPLSAYELTDLYNSSYQPSMPPMSVYRILNFLSSECLVHKLSSTNKYVACSNIVGDQNQEALLFLVCENCQSVKELLIEKSTISVIASQVASTGYTLVSPTLELKCSCEACTQTQHSYDDYVHKNLI